MIWYLMFKNPFCMFIKTKASVNIRLPRCIFKWKWFKVDHWTQIFKCYYFWCNLYISALWDTYTVKSFKSIHVAYNNVYNYLLNVKKHCSISQLFVTHTIDSFNIFLTKAVFSLMSQPCVSENIIVKSIVTYHTDQTFIRNGTICYIALWNLEKKVLKKLSS